MLTVWRGARARTRLAALLVFLGAVALLMAAQAGPQAPRATAAALPTPIQHVVVVYQENHSFDNVLGALCVQLGRCDGTTTGVRDDGKVVQLTTSPDVVPLENHNTPNQITAINGGAMDGFTKNNRCNAAHNYSCLSQYQPSQIPALARMATDNVIFDRFFETDTIPSWGSHVELVAATLDDFVAATHPVYHSGPGQPAQGPGWGCDSNQDELWKDPVTGEVEWVPSCIPDADGNGAYRATPVQYVPTIFDRLDEAGQPWKLYTQSYIWSICPTFAECLNSPQAKNMVKTPQFMTDAANGTLPAFSIVLPNGATGKTSQHNGTSMIKGDNFLASVVNAVQSGSDWDSTAIFITYDDCGCFYDHVAPPPGLGIRLPAVMVSPWAKRSYTDSGTASTASILAFTEAVFGMPPLSENDANAYNLMNAFDFSQTPTPQPMLAKTAVPQSSKTYIANHPVADDDT
jgi:phospholipase C